VMASVSAGAAQTPSSAQPAMHWIKGRVEASDRMPVSSVEVWAIKTGMPAGTVYKSKAKPDGTFELKDLPPGKYEVSVFPTSDSVAETPKPLTKKTDVEVAATKPDPNITFTLSTFSYFRVELLKDSRSLSGEVYLDGQSYG